MAIIQDGSHKFGILAPTVTGVDLTKGFVVESFTTTKSSNRVDLNDGDGNPSGAVTVPQREEVSLTLQIGSDASVPSVGDPMFINNTYHLITDLTINETQEDFVRFDTTLFKPENGVRPFRFSRTSNGEEYDLSGVTVSSSYGTLNRSSVFTQTITSTSFSYIHAFANNESSTTLYRFTTNSEDTLSSASSVFSSGTSLSSSGAGFFVLSVAPTATQVTAQLRYIS